MSGKKSYPEIEKDLQEKRYSLNEKPLLDWAETSVVLDMGASSMKVGFSRDDDIPREIYSSHIGIYSENNGLYFQPTIRPDGTIEDYDGVEKLVDFGLSNLFPLKNQDYKNFSIVVTEYPLIPKEQREKLTEMFFEKFGVSSYAPVKQHSAASFASKQKTGTFVNLGGGTCSVVCIYQGQILSKSITTAGQHISGESLTESLLPIVQKKNPYTNIDWNTANKIKENYCYLQSEGDNSIKLREHYKLPDGSELVIPKKALREVPESIFQPMGSYMSLQQAIIHSINSCDMSYQDKLWPNIVLFGGTSLLPGIDKYLIEQLHNAKKITADVKLLSNREYFPWRGCSLMKTRRKLPLVISRSDYEEFGASVVNKH